MNIVETKKIDHPYMPHLLLQETCVSSGSEWLPPTGGWTLMQVSSGTAYWFHGQSGAELTTGAVLLTPGRTGGRVLASCLNGVSLHFFTVVPERLPGLMTSGEHHSFTQAADRLEQGYRLLPANDPVAAKMAELRSHPGGQGLLGRLKLLQLLVEALGPDLEPAAAPVAPTNVTDRLRAFLASTAPAALLEISFEELAQQLCCTPRHLSRVFYEVAGISFRDKRAEIRLMRARELLATSHFKVVDVAFESGFKSLSLFNRMFTRRFGISPGRWRKKNGGVRLTVRKRPARPRFTLSPETMSAR
ncbi:MAG TPA: helix-turn-helix transcriptional regulator [Verrucomicrobiae bacterium]